MVWDHFTPVLFIKIIKRIAVILTGYCNKKGLDLFPALLIFLICSIICQSGQYRYQSYLEFYPAWL